MFTPNKDLGQNFLRDQSAIRKMIKALDAKEDEIIIEIGPGLGAVTKELMDNYGYTENITIKAVEVDIRFVEKLKNMFNWHGNFEVIPVNVLKWLPDFNPKEKTFRIIGSLPYNITSPIIHAIIKMDKLPKTCVILIQKEVAEKIRAEPPNSSYLSSFVQTFFEVEKIKNIKSGSFTPVPKVDGAILKLTKRKGIKIENVSKYEDFLHDTYKYPRKMLNKVFYKDELNRASIDGKKRPHAYGWEKWANSYTILK